MSLAKLKLAIAARSAELAAAATISFALNVVETGATEGTPVGVFTVDGFPTFKTFIAETGGGQFKVSSDLMGLDVGAVAPNAAVDPLVSISGAIVLPNGAVRLWAMDIVITGALSGLTVTLQPLTKTFIATGTVLAAIEAIADGNAVTIQHSTGSPIQVTDGGRYVPGTFVTPPPQPPYTGIENTGGGPPAEVALSVAKPALLCITPWRQQFHGKLQIAYVGDDESEIAEVRQWCEGSYVAITGRSWYWNDGSIWGREGWVYCWVGEIDAANYTPFGALRTRAVQVYAEAIPVDPTWQTRVIGHHATLDKENFKFFPVPSENELFEYLFEITPSAGADSIPGAAYPGVYGIFRKFEDAVRYAAGKTISGFTIPLAAVRAKFLGTETAAINPVNVVGFGTSSPYTSTKGYWLFECEDGVTLTIGRPGPWDTSSTGGMSGVQNNRWRLPAAPLRFGKGIKFDYTYFGGFDTPSGTGGLAPGIQYHTWWDGAETTCSWNMLTELDDFKNVRAGAGVPFMTGCKLRGTYTGTALIVRSNHQLLGPPGDIWTSTLAACGNRVDSSNFSQIREFREFFTIQGNVPGVDGYYLQKTSAGGSTTGSIIFGTRTGTTDTPLVTYPANGTVQALVALIDALDNVSAASLVTENDRVTDRNSKYLCNSLTAGVTTTGNFKTGAFTMRWTTTEAVTHRSYVDVHGDAFAFPAGGENRYYGQNQVFDVFSMQTVFFDGAAKSVVVEMQWTSGNSGNSNANYSVGAKNAVMIRGVSDPTIDGYFNATSPGQWDAHSKVEDIVYRGIQGATPVGTRPVVRNAHALGAVTNMPAPVGMTTGGAVAETTPGLAAFDNRPSGSMLLPANLVATPSTPFDAAGMRRLPNSPKGARGLGLTNGTYTKAQLLELAAYCSNNVVGAAVGTLAISGKSGAGETGDTVTTIITFDVAA